MRKILIGAAISPAMIILAVALILMGCEQPQLKDGVVHVKNVECIQHYDNRQRCTVTVLTRDTTRLYNARHIQVLEPGEELVLTE